jgi:hypothetical protein
VLGLPRGARRRTPRRHGAQTDACIRSTLHGAFVRGYDTILVVDAHTTEDLTAYGAPPPEQVIAFTNLSWEGQRAPGRHGDTVAHGGRQLRGLSGTTT